MLPLSRSGWYNSSTGLCGAIRHNMTPNSAMSETLCLYTYVCFRGPACFELLYNPAGMQHIQIKCAVSWNQPLTSCFNQVNWGRLCKTECVFGWQNTWLFIGVHGWYQVGFGALRRSMKQSPTWGDLCWGRIVFELPASGLQAFCQLQRPFSHNQSH